MKRLHIERFYLNRLDDEYPMTVRITLRLRDAVDEGMLREALEATRQRSPYLSVRLGVVRDDDLSEHYVYEDNPKPWVLSAGRQPVRLFGDEAGGHLLAFAWWDDCVALDFSHVLIDGDAAYRLLRTLLYEYCRRRDRGQRDHGRHPHRLRGGQSEAGAGRAAGSPLDGGRSVPPPVGGTGRKGHRRAGAGLPPDGGGAGQR